MFTPKFIISQQILKNIGQIEACKEIVTTAPLVPAWEKEFRSQAAIRTIHYGTHLEGNDLSLEEAKKVIEGEKVLGRERDIWEIINYRNVLKFIEKLGEEHRQAAPYTYNQTLLKKIHGLVVDHILAKEACGHYRNTRVVIRNSQNGEVVFSPIPPLEVSYQMEDFFDWLNSNQGKQMHPVLRAGIAHFELARIHPFVDGNGRVARAFATLILFMEDYDIKKFFSLEEQFDKDALSYYQALGSVSIHRGDLTIWLEYFTHVLATELNQVKEKVKRLSLDSRLKDKLGRQIALSERQVRIVEYLKLNDRLLMKDARKVLPDFSEDTILRDIKNLMKKGLVRKTGKTKAANYILTK
jgi:Fic family protein